MKQHRNPARLLEAGLGGVKQEIEAIVEKTDGVPLFVEELTKTILESDLLIETADRLELPSDVRATIRARAFEDNNGALLLATNQRLTNRTKFYLIKYHWFWSFVPREVTVHKISTELQRADYATKGLPREIFERIRKMVQGW